MKLLLNDKRVNPSDDYNWAIIEANKNNNDTMVNLLFSRKIVRETLKNDNETLYNKLIKKCIIKKVGAF